jgi:hypothetical protein
MPGEIKNDENGDLANDHYHRYYAKPLDRATVFADDHRLEPLVTRRSGEGFGDSDK